MAYYPKQNIPDTFCGLAACGGELLETVELPANSDFDRTFGVLTASCVTEQEVRNRCHFRVYIYPVHDQCRAGEGRVAFQLGVGLPMLHIFDIGTNNISIRPALIIRLIAVPGAISVVRARDCSVILVNIWLIPSHTLRLSGPDRLDTEQRNESTDAIFM